MSAHSPELEDRVLAFAFSSVGISVVAPLQRVKLLLQTQDANKHIRSGEVARYQGWWNCFSRVSAEQGLTAFWRGNLVACGLRVPGWAFFVPNSYLVMNATASTVAGLCASLAVYPLEMARTRLAADVGPKRRDFDGLLDLFNKASKGPYGIFSVYSGALASLLRALSYRGLHYTLYEALKPLCPRSQESTVTKALIAQASTIAMQTEKPHTERLYSGMVDCFQKIAVQEGLRGFFKGALFHCISVGGALSLLLTDELLSRRRKAA